MPAFAANTDLSLVWWEGWAHVVYHLCMTQITEGLNTKTEKVRPLLARIGRKSDGSLGAPLDISSLYVPDGIDLLNDEGEIASYLYPPPKGPWLVWGNIGRPPQRASNALALDHFIELSEASNLEILNFAKQF